jgi:hypothetical protein
MSLMHRPAKTAKPSFDLFLGKHRLFATLFVVRFFTLIMFVEIRHFAGV